MHLYLQLTRSLAVTLIWLYCNKLVLRYVRLRVSDLGQVSIPQPGIVTRCVCVTIYAGDFLVHMQLLKLTRTVNHNLVGIRNVHISWILISNSWGGGG